jgi:hypothetical protein|tara:strand:+ start:7759 stop:8637 length:879 start_codon:yes stop_codon:yes gene_type:complete
MKSQFDHELLSSFYLWFDDVLVRRNDSYIEQSTGISFVQKVAGTAEDADDIPPNLDAFYAPFRQLVGQGTGVPSGVYINGIEVNQGTSGLLIDFNEARVLIESGAALPSGTPITGSFNTKEVNVYITNDSEEDLILNNDFYVDAYGNTYLQNKSDLNGKKFTLPAAFISYNGSQNVPRAFGGLEDTQAYLRVVAVVQDNYTLDGMISMFRDSARETFPVISYDNFPYGEFFHIKNPPYTYTGLVASNLESSQMYIEKVTTSKLFDKTNKSIPMGVRIGFLDFDLSNFRYPRP